METSSLHQRAQLLLQKIIQECQKCTHSSHTVAIYDTAWVSMIVKTVNGEPHWAFPESFQYLVQQQESDGGWSGRRNSEDGILNTLAGLLAMKRHQQIAAPALDANLHVPIAKAVLYLQDKLQQWDVGVDIPISFEILVPALLSMLEQEQFSFQFPRKPVLMSLNAQKLRNFDPSKLYGNQNPSLIYSLEAFIGKIDFDKVQHHKTLGSMMCSPSSTAAYLMHCSTWDVEAENFIRNAIRHGSGMGNGGVPGVYPANIFDITWAVSTLIQAGYTTEALNHQNVKDIVSYLESRSCTQEGLLGFAPFVLEDGDDTAKAVLTLNLLDRPTSPEKMIAHFKGHSRHLLTFHGERNPSSGANCNGLMAILRAPEIDRYLKHIEHITDFLCDLFLSGPIQDKWNSSPYYPMMLLAEALIRLVKLWSDGHLGLLPHCLIQGRVLVVLIQILNRTLLTQHADGNWGGEDSPEETAYGILTLLALQDLPHARLLAPKIQSAIHAGRQALVQTERQWVKPQNLWLGKVTYGCSILAEAYCLAAMNGPVSHHTWSTKMEQTVTTADVMSLSKFLQKDSAYAHIPGWKILASVLEGSLYLQRLRDARREIYPPSISASKDKFLDYVPTSWILVNNCNGLFLHSTLIWDMMLVSVLGYLVDEYMESVVSQLRDSDITLLQQTVRALCRKSDVITPEVVGPPHEDSRFVYSNGTPEPGSLPEGLSNGYSEPLAAVIGMISSHVRALVEHPRIQKASPEDQSWLRAELELFLLAHIDQIQDNHRFQSQGSGSFDETHRFQTPRTNHYAWSHTTAAYNSAVPVSFAFYACRLASDSGTGVDLFPSSCSKYLAREVSSHTAVMTRLYNDYGSVARDRAERNLNSVNFSEFQPRQAEHDDPTTTQIKAKDDLLRLARYERSCVKSSFQALVATIEDTTVNGAKLGDCLGLFVDVACLYADMYEARDISNRIR